MTTIFTRIINGEIPGTFVHRDQHCVAFMSINPITDGHLLVVPIDEYDHWIDMPEPLNTHVFTVARDLSRAMHKAFACERVGLIIAGFEVNHCHIHLIPTWSMADLNFSNAASTVTRATLEKNAGLIVEALAS